MNRVLFSTQVFLHALSITHKAKKKKSNMFLPGGLSPHMKRGHNEFFCFDTVFPSFPTQLRGRA